MWPRSWLASSALVVRLAGPTAPCGTSAGVSWRRRGAGSSSLRRGTAACGWGWRGSGPPLGGGPRRCSPAVDALCWSVRSKAECPSGRQYSAAGRPPHRGLCGPPGHRGQRQLGPGCRSASQPTPPSSHMNTLRNVPDSCSATQTLRTGTREVGNHRPREQKRRRVDCWAFVQTTAASCCVRVEARIDAATWRAGPRGGAVVVTLRAVRRAFMHGPAAATPQDPLPRGRLPDKQVCPEACSPFRPVESGMQVSCPHPACYLPRQTAAPRSLPIARGGVDGYGDALAIRASQGSPAVLRRGCPVQLACRCCLSSWVLAVRVPSCCS